MKKRMYTIHGQAVELVRQVEGGFLAKQFFESYLEDEDSDPEEAVSDQVEFFEQLFDKPVVEKYAEEIKKLKQDESDLNLSIDRLRAAKRSEEGLLNKISQFPFFQMLADYLTGDFHYYLDLKDYEIKPKGNSYHSPYVSIIHTKTRGFQLRKMSNDEYHSDYDRMFLIFKTREEVVEFSKKHFINHILHYESTYNPAYNLKEWWEKLSATNDAKADMEVYKAYTDKYAALLELQNKKRADEIQKEIDDKKKQLEKLSIPS